MKKYEALVILNPDLADEQKEAIIKKIFAPVESAQGTIDGVDKWGVKKLAYTIKFKHDGYFALVTFTAPTSVVKEITNQANLLENVFRCVITAK